MDRRDVKRAVIEFFQKYRWTALVLVLGLLMMCVPEKSGTMSESAPQEIITEPSLQMSLEEILSGLEGAGKVKVLLTIRTGERYHYQTDEDLQKTENSLDQKKETVIITSTERQEHGLLLQTDPPSYLGALILCQGADSARVRLSVVEAVSTVTGLGADQISVLKMK